MPAVRLESLLEKLGYGMAGRAESGEEAIQLAKALKPDLVMMDIVMPGPLDGIDACEEIQKQLNIPVVLVSGFGDDDIIARARHANPYGFVLKPYKSGQIKAAMEIALEKKQLETRYHKSELALRKSEQQYRSTIDAIGDAIHVVDRDLNCIIVNAALRKWCGELNLEHNPTGRSILEALPFLPDQVEREYEQVFSSGEKKVSEDCLKIGNREILTETLKIPVFEGNRVIRVVTVFRDITERRQLEELRQYNELFESVSDGVFICNTDGKLLEMNEMLPATCGYETNELKGIDVRNLVNPPDAGTLEKILDAGNTEKPARAEFEMIKKDGDLVPVSVRYRHISYAGESSVLCVIRNLTELILLRNKLIQSERLAATGQLASSVAHEINSPLQAVISTLSVMEQTRGDEKLLKENIGLISKAFRNIRKTARNLLDLNRPGNEEKQSVNINEELEKMAALVRCDLLAQRIRIGMDLAPDIPMVQASPQQLSQLFLNLIRNSMESITDSVPDEEESQTMGSVSIATRKKQDHLAIIFSDSGPGIAEKNIERIFDPFYTTKRKMGMGMGLSICHFIMESHNGRIFAENSPDGGAVFTITLPLHESGHGSMEKNT